MVATTRICSRLIGVVAAAAVALLVGAVPPTAAASSVPSPGVPDLPTAIAILQARGVAADDAGLTAARTLVDLGGVRPELTPGAIGAPTDVDDPLTPLRFDVAPVSPDCGFSAGQALAGHISKDDWIGVWFQEPIGSRPILPLGGMKIVWFDFTTLQGGSDELGQFFDTPSSRAIGTPTVAGSVRASRNPVLVAVYGTDRNTVNTCTYLPGFKMVPAV